MLDADTVAGGWRLVEYLKSHLRRVHGEILVGKDLRRLRALVKWMKRREGKAFKNGYVLHDLSIYGNAEELYKALDVLEQFGYLRKVWSPQTPGPKGGRPSGPTYLVNPKVIG